MSKPCDTGICDTLTCSAYDECLVEELAKPSVGSIAEEYEDPCDEYENDCGPCVDCLTLFCLDRNGPDAHECTKQNKGN